MTKYNIKIVREFCESIGVKLLSTEYKNIKTNLLFRCPLCGKDYQRTFNNILNRKNPLCQSCSKRISQSKRFSYEDVKKFIESQGCKLISGSYINVDSPLEIQCRCGNKYIRTFYKFKNGNRECPECSLQHRRNKIAIPEDEIAAIIPGSVSSLKHICVTFSPEVRIPRASVMQQLISILERLSHSLINALVRNPTVCKIISCYIGVPPRAIHYQFLNCQRLFFK